ncbi:tryptophan synthase alpha chain [Vibrio ishigakensis]|uniref:Tryptophan synthase alpha chain n=1 Tax=Vibrio ishigakensis TaxID=1481914 RepID=A0A0B8P8X0_9VIBR|nr:tryptophan synthase alpha chain [Vibrio ishigakensis]
MPVQHMLDRLNQFDAPPALLGFGISEPSQVKTAIELALRVLSQVQLWLRSSKQMWVIQALC